jgi:hypothetical protein
MGTLDVDWSLRLNSPKKKNPALQRNAGFSVLAGQNTLHHKLPKFLIACRSKLSGANWRRKTIAMPHAPSQHPFF